MEHMAYDDGHCIVAFMNSSGELEYTVYKALDGGTIDINGDGEFLDELTMTAEEYIESPELKEIS